MTKAEPEKAEPDSVPVSGELNEATLPQIWSAVLDKVGGMLAKELRKIDEVAIFGPNALVIRFPARYNFVREQCQDPSRVRQIEQALQAITGKPGQIRIEAKPEEPETSASGASLTRSAVPAVRAGARKKVPRLLRRAMDKLAAQELRREDGFADTEPPDEEANAAGPQE